tara:strand:+ start:896 stop:1573 length:678 start_codon:yes stop_codon:yes gene_type:complete
MPNIINSFIKFPTAAGGTLLAVSIYNGDEFLCCTGGFSSTNVLVDDTQSISPSVNDVISVEMADGTIECAIVTAINQTGSTSNESFGGTYLNCGDCYNQEALCFGEGGFCLLPDMIVKIKSGLLIKVKDLEIGDFIEGPNGFTKITFLDKNHPRDSYYIINNELHISDDHPILVDGYKLVKAKDYNGPKKLIKQKVDTVNIITEDKFFNVYCNDNIYTVDGHYSK